MLTSILSKVDGSHPREHLGTFAATPADISTSCNTNCYKNLDGEMRDIYLGYVGKSEALQSVVGAVLDLLRSAERPTSPCEVINGP